MILTALDFLKKRKEKKKKDNNSESNNNTIKKKKSSKTKKNVKTSNNVVEKREKKSSFPFSQSSEKKEERKRIKEAKQQAKFENLSLTYLLFTQIIIIYFAINCFSFFFTKGTPIEGTLEFKDNVVYFKSIYEKVNYIEDNSLKNLEVGDKIYLVKGKNQLYLSNKRKLLGFCITGEITKKDDYYLYIDYNYQKLISGNTEFFSKQYNNETNTNTYTVYMKKFLFEYKIDEEILQQIKQSSENSIEDFKKDFINGFNLKDLIGGK